MLEELDATLRTDPDRPALLGCARSGRTRVLATRGELAGLADRYAAALHHRGLRPGDTLGVAVRPGPRSIAVLLAGYRLGLRLAVLDPSAGPDVLLARLALARPALVLADAAAQAVAGWARPLARRVQLALPRLDRLGPVATVGGWLPGCAPRLARPRMARVPSYGQPDGDALVVFTSGTTTRPRAVVHTWASVSVAMRTVAELVRNTSGRPVLGGASFVLIPALAGGVPVAMPARSTAALVRQLRQLCPQETYLTPPRVRDALAAGARFTGRVWMGSAPVSAELLARVTGAGAQQACGVYALTELFPVAVVDAAAKAAHAGDGDLVGELVPGVSARVDADGQLLVRGPGGCDRYLGEPPLTWIATGDVGRLEPGAAGTRVVLAGRCKDMILRGAENVYPGLYEPALYVPGVNLAIMVGVAADDGDERIAAVVELIAGADQDRVRAALAVPLRRMGAARPDALVFAEVPLAGRSRKPDRIAAAALATARLGAPAPEATGGAVVRRPRLR